MLLLLEAEQTPGWHSTGPFLCCSFLLSHSSPLPLSAPVVPCLLFIKRRMLYCSFLMNLRMTKVHSAVFVRHLNPAEIQVDTWCCSGLCWPDLQPTPVCAHLKNRGHRLHSVIQRGCDSFLWQQEMLLLG